MIGLRDPVLCCPCPHPHWYHPPSKSVGLSWGWVGPGSSEHSSSPFKPDVLVELTYCWTPLCIDAANATELPFLQQLLKSVLDMRVYKTKIGKQNKMKCISYLRICTLLENITNFMLEILERVIFQVFLMFLNSLIIWL